jgi:glycosyltransferase involved in cell wall biosynthesis
LAGDELMRICMVTDTFWPRINGISTSISTLSRALCALGQEVTIVAPDYEHLPSRRQFEAAKTGCTADVIRFPAHSLLFFPEDCSTTLISRRYRHQANLVRQMDFDVVHTHTPLMLGILSMYWQRGKRVPMVHTFHTLFEDFIPYYFPFCYLPAWLSRRFGHWFSLNVFHWYCNRFNQIIAPSTQVADLLEGYYLRPPVAVIPTGIDVERFRTGNGARLREGWGIGPGEKLLLFVGRVGLEKGIDLILRAMPAVLDSELAAHLVIVGRGPAEDTLRRIARELGIASRVHLVGYQPPAQMADVYAAADLFLFASRTESQGLVTVEALASGTPVIAVRGPGTLDIMDNEQGGLLSPPDPGAFARRIVRLLQDPALYAAKCAQARRRAQAFSSLAMGRRMLALYESLSSSSESVLTQANLRRSALG